MDELFAPIGHFVLGDRRLNCFLLAVRPKTGLPQVKAVKVVQCAPAAEDQVLKAALAVIDAALL